MRVDREILIARLPVWPHPMLTMSNHPMLEMSENLGDLSEITWLFLFKLQVRVLSSYQELWLLVNKLAGGIDRIGKGGGSLHFHGPCCLSSVVVEK